MVAPFPTQHPTSGTGVSPFPAPPPPIAAPAPAQTDPQAWFEAVFLAGPDHLPAARPAGHGSATGHAAEAELSPPAATDPVDPLPDHDPPQDRQIPPDEPRAGQQAGAAAAPVVPEAQLTPHLLSQTGAGRAERPLSETGPDPVMQPAAREHERPGAVPPFDLASTGPAARQGPGPAAFPSGRPSGAASAQAGQQAQPGRAATPRATASPMAAAGDGTGLSTVPALQAPGIALPAALGPGRESQRHDLAPAALPQPDPGKPHGARPGMPLTDMVRSASGSGMAATDHAGAQGKEKRMAQARGGPFRDTTPRPATPPVTAPHQPVPAASQAEVAMAHVEPAASQETRTPPPSGPLPGPAASAPGHVAMPRSDLPQAIAYQIAMTARRSGAGERSVELELSPRELGRVRMQLISGDGIMTVNMLVDRPETLDLMRRHGDLLERAMHDIGYHRTEFSFADGRSDTTGQQAAAPPTEPGATTEPQSTLVIDLAGRAGALSGDRLDLLI